ncbi:2138_t:CDS:1, partial [Paraglomus brasilianum]
QTFVQHLREVHYGSFPEIRKMDTRFAYVPVHLEYIVAEVLKNACRATVELSQKVDRKDHPAIEVTISRGKSNIGIRVRNQGGAINSYTTAKQENYYWGLLPL